MASLPLRPLLRSAKISIRQPKASTSYCPACRRQASTSPDSTPATPAQTGEDQASYLNSLRSVWRSWFSISQQASTPEPAPKRSLLQSIPKQLEAELSTSPLASLLEQLFVAPRGSNDLCWAILLELESRNALLSIPDSKLSRCIKQVTPVSPVAVGGRKAELQWERYRFILDIRKARGLGSLAKDCLRMLNCLTSMGYAPAVIRIWTIVRQEKLLKHMGLAKKEHAYVVMLKVLADWQTRQTERNRQDQGDMVPQAAELMREMVEQSIFSETAMSWGLRVVKEAGRPKSFNAVVKAHYGVDVNLPEESAILEEAKEESNTRPYTITRHVLNTILLSLYQRNELASMIAVFETCSRIPYRRFNPANPSQYDDVQKRLSTVFRKNSSAISFPVMKYNLDMLNTTTLSLLCRAAQTSEAPSVMIYYALQAFAITRAANIRLESDLCHLLKWKEPLSHARVPLINISSRIVAYVLKSLDTDRAGLQRLSQELTKHLNQLNKHQQTLRHMIPTDQQSAFVQSEQNAKEGDFKLSVHLKTTAKSIAGCENGLKFIHKVLARQAESRKLRLEKRKVLEDSVMERSGYYSASPEEDGAGQQGVESLAERLQKLQARTEDIRSEEENVRLAV